MQAAPGSNSKEIVTTPGSRLNWIVYKVENNFMQVVKLDSKFNQMVGNATYKKLFGLLSLKGNIVKPNKTSATSAAPRKQVASDNTWQMEQ